MATGWTRIRFDCDDRDAPRLGEAMEGLGAIAVTTADAGDRPIHEPAPGATPLWPRVVITGDRDLMTPPLGLRMFKSDLDGNEYGPMMAATTVIVLPLVFIFLLAQRRFIEGITMTGMK